MAENKHTDGRVAEDDGGDVLVVHLEVGLPVEETVGEPPAGRDCD